MSRKPVATPAPVEPTMDIEAGARAAFQWLHEANHRRRNWDNHPDEDIDVELGRKTFRGMVAAAVGVMK